MYGPRDTLFLSTVLENGAKGRLRCFGSGRNRVAFTYVDNYCHALMLAEQALRPGSKALGGFYIVTDGATHPQKAGYLDFWTAIDEAALRMGFKSVLKKRHLPLWLLWTLAYVCEAIGWVLGVTLKLSAFNVRMLTMNRWFVIDAAEADLGYQPIVHYHKGWYDTLTWFKENWLPSFNQHQGITGLASGTQNKIDIQAASEFQRGKGRAKAE